ncbi:lipopolysaccharide kinase InaA family protein [Candidatus Avelusimicrobium caledoniensis]|uniref:lipopolysaccharide kinase InaA family protein n=1 Tax=Candidatus Avelusimicrobium caledoniensis TaxID=3416220 RepID=UPI003D0BB426
MKSTSENVQNTQAPLPENFVVNLPDTFANGGEIIHNARNQIRVFDVNNHKINVKKFCIPPIVNRILYSLGWRTPKAVSTYKNAQEILKRGFHTPAPYGYRIERKGGLINFSYFVSEQVENMRPVRDTQNDPALINALAKYTADMHAKGLWHKDFTPGNILYRVENGKHIFSLVDINRFKFFDGPVPKNIIKQNLIQPFYDDKNLRTFVEEYARITGWRGDLVKEVLRRKHIRNAYDKFKHDLKKLPGAYIFLNKPFEKQK